MLHTAIHPSLPATGVTHTVSGTFSPNLPTTLKDVVFFCGNRVVLYCSDTSNPDAPLGYVTECALYAPPLSVAVCRAHGAAVDAIAMLLDDYHVSFIQYNPLLRSFGTVALVRLDDRELFMERCALHPLLRVDPTGAFVAIFSKRRELFVFQLLKKVSREEMAVAQAESDGAKLPAAESGAIKAPHLAGIGGGYGCDALEPAAIKVAQSKKSIAKVALDAWGDDDDLDEEENCGRVEAEDGAGDREGISSPTVGASPHEPSDAKAHEKGGPREPGGGVPPQHLLPTSDLDDIIVVGDITRVLLCDIKDTLRNVRDLQFVETNSGEPLMVFLYEPQPTWAGRVRLVEWRSKSIEANMLTCSILWVRLILGVAAAQQLQLLPIGDVDHLSFNTTHLTPLPAFENVPSAVLAVGRNVVAHVSTKSGYGAYINRNGHEEVQFARSSAIVYDAMRWFDQAQERATDLVRTNLNFANATVLPLTTNDTEKEGAIGNRLQLLLFTEDEGTVVKIIVQTQGYAVSGFTSSIVMTGCFCSSYCNVGQNLFFLGSCRGDSRVVSMCNGDTISNNVQGAVLMSVRQTIVGLAPVHDVEALDCTTMASAAVNGETGIENLLGRSVVNSPYVDLYHSVVLDPVRRLPLAQRQQVMDLVVCSGLGHSGAFCVLRHSIRNNVIRREEVNAISAFFLEPRAYHATSSKNHKRPRHEGERSADDFATHGMEDRPSLPSADVAHLPHLLMTGNGFTLLFEVRADSVQQVRGTVFNIMSRTLFAAELSSLPGLVQVTGDEFRVASLDGKRTFHHVFFNTASELPSDCGPARAAFCIPPTDSHITQESLVVHFEGGHLVLFALKDLKSPISARLVLSDVRSACVRLKTSELVAIQGMDLVFVGLEESKIAHRFPNFSLLPPYALENVEVPLAKLSSRLREEPLPMVTHIQIFEHPAPSSGCMVSCVECTLVLLVASGEMLTYKLLPGDAHGPPRLLKAFHHFLDLVPEREVIETIETKKRRLVEERLHAERDITQARHSSERLIPFNDIGGCEGIYVCGQHPVFLIYDDHRRELVASHHQTTESVRGFCPFSSRNVKGGYVFCSSGYVHFATMQLFGQNLGHGWWMQRVPLGQTPHFVAYSSACHGCFVATSTLEPFSPKRASFDTHLRINYDEEGNKTISDEEPVTLPPLSSASGAPVPLNERYEVKLLTSNGEWRCEGKFLLEENEKALSMQCIEISRDTAIDTSPQPGMTMVCVVATAFPLGENVTTRGRLLLLATKHIRGKCQMTLLHSEPLKGPATAVAGIRGSIAVAVGGTIRVFRYDHIEKKMEIMAMLYAGSYVTHISAVRDYLFWGDLYASAALAHFSAANHTLTVLGKDFNHYAVVHTNIAYRGFSFGLVVTDNDRNVAILGYTPRLQRGTDPKQPQKLLESILSVEAEYRVPGGSIRKMLRLRSLQRQQPTAVNAYVTELGEVGFMVPISDQVNRTAQWVVRRLQGDIAHPAGLSPRMFLGFKQQDCARSIKAKEKMIHAPLLNELFHFDLRSRKAIAAAAQTQLDRALNAAVAIYVETLLF